MHATAVEINFITLTAPTRESLLTLVEKYKRPRIGHAAAFQMAWTRAQTGSSAIWESILPRLIAFQELASHLIYPNGRLRASLRPGWL